MPYFAVDDGAHWNLKFRRASMAARGLWVTVGSWVSGALTDGHVPGDVIKMLGGTGAQVRSLVASGLWHDSGHGCTRCPQPRPGDFYMHDYADSGNRSRAEIQARREASAEGSRRHRGRQQPRPPAPPGEQLDLGDIGQPPDAPRRAPISPDWQPSREDVHAAQVARGDAGLPQLTADQIDAVTTKFVRRMADDGSSAVAWGGRWRQWAEGERIATAGSPDGGVVVPFGQQKPTRSQQQRAGLDRLRAKYEGGTTA
ncbi:hypothetical protein AB4225_06260 [Streptomyces sp. 2RAF24]|uniref:hypothetical protein n=1 Tax=Streptomyces sp. 2RAF24 TaxID=3232997 RepID=UPI003F96D1A2